MASKTISLKIDAYERLRLAKRPRESFSEVIRRIVPPVKGVAENLANRVQEGNWGKNVAWDRVEHVYRSRRRRIAP
ncbi:MAG: hypothetical protein JSR95_05765 [Proteobacteria bacterium]|nr:hypothetical protein [Pseudomonadota bacterium]